MGSGITVKELMDQLRLQKPDDEVLFGQSGHFSYSLVKDRTGIAQIEFNETEGVDYQVLPAHPNYKGRK